jgi:hypothetical protein
MIVRNNLEGMVAQCKYLQLWLYLFQVDSKRFWRWCITHRMIRFLDFFHRPVFWRTENTTFRKVDLFPCSGDTVVQWLNLALYKGPKWVGIFTPFTWGRKQIQFPKRRVLYSLEFRMMEKVLKSNNFIYLYHLLVSSGGLMEYARMWADFIIHREWGGPFVTCLMAYYICIQWCR